MSELTKEEAMQVLRENVIEALNGVIEAFKGKIKSFTFQVIGTSKGKIIIRTSQGTFEITDFEIKENMIEDFKKIMNALMDEVKENIKNDLPF